MTDGAIDLLAGLVLEDGRRWGEAATPHQWDDAKAVLATDGGPRRHWLGRARGWSKTTDVAGLTLAAMLTQLPPGSHCYGAAGDQDQARLLRDAADGFARRTSELRGAVEVAAYRVTVRNGTTLEILSADAATSWGITPDWVVIDEVSQWLTTANAQALWESLTTAVPKRQGSRLVVISTAGSPGSWQQRAYLHAASDGAWRLSETDGPPPWIPVEEIEAERRRLPESSFRRWWCNQWVQTEDRLVRPDDLAACRTLVDFPTESRPRTRYVISVDLGLKRDATVVMVAHAEPRSAGFEEGAPAHTVVLDNKAVWRGTRDQPVSLSEVEAWIAAASRRYNNAPVTLDPWQAAMLAERLRARGVRVSEYVFSQTSIGRLAQRLHLALRDRALALPADDSDLADELLNVQLRETSPGVFRLDHDPARHDDQAIALGLASMALADGEAMARRRALAASVSPGGGRKTSHWSGVAAGIALTGSGGGAAAAGFRSFRDTPKPY